jgi:glycosyltransferase involved in cell wall biosynthesis
MSDFEQAGGGVPVITVILPTYNRSNHLPQAVRSVLDNGYADVELIIVDDGSTDDTAQVMAAIAAEDSRVKYFTKENGGVSTARNYGLDHATGKYVCFLDDDDRLVEGALGRFAAAGEDTGAQIVIGYNQARITIDGYSVQNDVRTRLRYSHGLPEVFSYRDIRENYLGLFTGSANTMLFLIDYLREKNLRFEPGLEIAQDGIFSLMAGRCVERAIVIDEPLCELAREAGHDNTTNQRGRFDAERYDALKRIRGIIDDSDGISDKEASYVRYVLNYIARNSTLLENEDEYAKLAQHFRNVGFDELGITAELVHKHGNKKNIELYNSIMDDTPPPFPLSRDALRQLSNNKLRERNHRLKKKVLVLRDRNARLKQKVKSLRGENKKLRNRNKKLRKRLKALNNRKIIRMIKRFRSFFGR